MRSLVPDNPESIASTENLRSAAAALALDRADAEEAVAAVVMSDPRNVPHVLACGIQPIHFSHADFRLIFLAGVVCYAEKKPEQRFTVARMALEQAGKWSDRSQIRESKFSEPWNSENLKRIGSSYYYCPATSAHRGKVLMDLCRREAAARWHLREAIRALRGAAHLAEQADEQPPSIGRAA